MGYKLVDCDRELSSLVIEAKHYGIQQQIINANEIHPTLFFNYHRKALQVAQLIQYDVIETSGSVELSCS